MRVLILEPQIDLAGLLKKVFKDQNYQVDHAVSAQQAVHKADLNKPDAVVLELNLAGHNGLEFLYELRSHADWKNVPVIIYSHTSLDESRLGQEARERLGISHYLYKPVCSLQTLVESVQGAVLEPAR